MKDSCASVYNAIIIRRTIYFDFTALTRMMKDDTNIVGIVLLLFFRKGGTHHVQENAEERPRLGGICVNPRSGRYCDYHYSVRPWSRDRQRIQPDHHRHINPRNVGPINTPG